VNLSSAQIAALEEISQIWPDRAMVIIGATALGLFVEMRWRQTADLDLVIAIGVDDLQAIAQRPGWHQSALRQHEFRSPQGARMDILPAAATLIERGTLAWPSGHVMSLAGMDLAFVHAVAHDLGAGHRVHVAPPAVVTVLKMTAFGDRPRSASAISATSPISSTSTSRRTRTDDGTRQPRSSTTSPRRFCSASTSASWRASPTAPWSPSSSTASAIQTRCTTPGWSGSARPRGAVRRRRCEGGWMPFGTASRAYRRARSRAARPTLRCEEADKASPGQGPRPRRTDPAVAGVIARLRAPACGLRTWRSRPVPGPPVPGPPRTPAA
jgi:hypothetical protein